jgi:hypothetical protein
LGAPIHHPEFVNVKISASCATFEWRRTIADQSFSIIRKVHKRFRQVPDDFLKRLNFTIAGFELTVAVVKE